jgi:hypothetical protein
LKTAVSTAAGTNMREIFYMANPENPCFLTPENPFLKRDRGTIGYQPVKNGCFAKGEYWR